MVLKEFYLNSMQVEEVVSIYTNILVLEFVVFS